MKNLLRSWLRRSGYELLHAESDPVLGELRGLHERLRLEPPDSIRWSDTLSLPAAHNCFRSVLQKHAIDLVLDVGANRGQFAELIRRLGYRGEIISFEPLARHRPLLETAAARDPSWRVYPIALGRAAGEAELHVYQDDTFSSLQSVNQNARDRFHALVTEQAVERVTIRRLDELWPDLCGGRRRRVLLKTDTQGHDLAVLDGAKEILPEVQVVIAEAAFLPLYEQAPLFVDLASWLGTRGFTVSGLFPISHNPADLALIEMDCVFVRRLEAHVG